MPRKQGAVAVGRMTCPGCGDRIPVFQNVKDYLYTRCANCGCDQRNGEAVQVAMWSAMEAIEGAEIRRPRNVPESVPMGAGLVAPKEAEPAAVPVGAEPATAPVQEPAKPQETPAAAPVGAQQKKKGGIGFLVLGMLGLGAALITAGAGGAGVAKQ